MIFIPDIGVRQLAQIPFPRLITSSNNDLQGTQEKDERRCTREENEDFRGKKTEDMLLRTAVVLQLVNLQLVNLQRGSSTTRQSIKLVVTNYFAIMQEERNAEEESSS